MLFQEVNETMEMSPFDGLEGATGGTDYDSTSYGHHRSHTRSSGNSEVRGVFVCYFSTSFFGLHIPGVRLVAQFGF